MLLLLIFNLVVLDGRCSWYCKYIIDVGYNNRFSGFKEIGEVVRKIVVTNKDNLYSMIYLFMILVMILPVASTIVEKKISVLTFIKKSTAEIK